jgi:hypothetical protein
VWARFDVLANDGPIASDASVRIVEAPTRGVVSVEEDGRCRYRSDWHVDGVDRFTYALIEGGVERARHRVEIEVRDELWLALGGRPYRAHLDVGGAPAERDAPADWETVLRDVSDDGRWFVGERLRGEVTRGFSIDEGGAATELVIGEQATYARRIEGADVLGGTRLAVGTTQGLRASRAGLVLVAWEGPGAVATWPLGVQDGVMVARIDEATTRSGARLSRLASGEVMAAPLELGGGAPNAVAGTRLAGVRAHDARMTGFVREGAGALEPVEVPDALEVSVEDIDAAGWSVGRVVRGGPFETSFVRAPTGELDALSLRTMLETSAFGLSARGDIVGSVRDIAGFRRSLWLEPVTDPRVAAMELSPTEEPPHPGIDHACFHARLGPFESVDASTTADLAAAVALRAGHVTYTVTLVGARSYIAIHAVRPDEEIAVFLETRSSVVRPLDREGRNVRPAFAERTDTCAQLGFLMQVRAPASGPVILEIESTEPTLTFVLERTWVYRG